MLPISELRALLAHQLGVSREWLIARPEQSVPPDVVRDFLLRVERRQRGEPLAYLLGEKEFYGRAFIVSPAVLIPRPETELLVEVSLGRQSSADASVLELGTGSGCVAITLALERPQWQVTAIDLATDALDIARRNIARWHVTHVSLQNGHWFGALPRNARFSLIVSNPPYVAAGDPHLDALRFEPRLALTADDDGLASLRTIIEAAPSYLAPDGALVLEHGSTQGPAVRNLLSARGGHDVQTASDLAGLERVTSARFGGV
ncbi:MAG: peptide chain release factor N(5)-glutamine methyltransferase [Burkholderiaceae bacterium]|nr:peptide chain release factor N(5)-glutamine methyltransferase [Burkholderiaceae bacterium]